MLKYHIQTVEVGSGGAASILFDNIPQTYDDLLILYSIRSARSGAADNLQLNINNQGVNTNITTRILYGTGASTAADTFNVAAGGLTSANTNTANTFSNCQIYISDYTSSNPKLISSDSVTENNSTEGYQCIVASLWNQTAAISSIALDPQFSDNMQYSSASLYGIKHGSSGEIEVAAGGVVTTSGGYTIHTFESSGTFVANQNVEAEVLIVAGGGGGGAPKRNLSSRNPGGGGGGGGYLEGTLNFSAGSSIPVLVGAGGSGTLAGGTDNSTAASGTNSVLLSAVAIGGGGGGNGDYSTAASGGSAGGGAGGPAGGTTVAPALQGNVAGLTGYGNVGTIDSVNNTYGGGGGGAGGASPSRPTGGAAKTSVISGSSQSYAGGGGGGGYNNGGGDRSGGTNAGSGGGTSNVSGGNAVANYGGGGGGAGSGTTSSTSNVGGNGGSGVVIIRYLTPSS